MESKLKRAAKVVALVLDPKFAQCKACVEQCEKDFPQDQIQPTQCESSCAE